MYFHQAIAQALVDQGTTTIFGVLGDANLFMVESFVSRNGGKYYGVCHEAAAVLAARGYHAVSGALGVATVTHGAGMTNTITPLIEAVKDRTSMLVVAGDTAVHDKDNWHNVPQRDIALASGAGFEQVRTPQTVAEDVAVAVRRAQFERRPIVLNVPADFQWVEVEHEPVPRRFVEEQHVHPDPAALDVAVGVIASARRPVVLAGRGATSAGARSALLRLAGRLGAPVATTLQAKDLFRGERFDLGICGTLAHDVALATINEADCLIAFGASMNEWTTGHGSLAADTSVVHIDIDRAAIGRHAAPGFGLVGDAAATADAIVAYLDEAEVAPSGYASDELAERLAGFVESVDERSTEDTVSLRAALRHIDEGFPADRTVVLDAGRFVLHCFTLLRVPGPSAYIHTANYASVGLGAGTAIGAAIGAPQRPVLHVTGDGGLMMGGLAEFNTAVRYGLDVVVFVMNDSSYGAEHFHLRNRGMDPAITMFGWPDFASVANALGGRGLTVRSLDELDKALVEVGNRAGPMLIDVKIDPDNVAMVGM